MNDKQSSGQMFSVTEHSQFIEEKMRSFKYFSQITSAKSNVRSNRILTNARHRYGFQNRRFSKRISEKDEPLIKQTEKEGKGSF